MEGVGIGVPADEGSPVGVGELKLDRGSQGQQGTIGPVRALATLVHPAPTAAVVGLTVILAAILNSQSGGPGGSVRILLISLSVAGSQVMTGALNDWADRHRDARVQPSKPIPAGAISPRSALAVSVGGLAVQIAASYPLGPLPLILGLMASASAAAYDLWLSRTALSFLPYLVSFGLLPLWIASAIGVPLERVAAAPVIVGPFAVAAHLANTVRDFEQDARIGSRSLAQRLGRRSALAGAWGIAMAVGIGVGLTFAASGRLDAASGMLGIVGLAAVGFGIRGPRWLWFGLLVAAVAWTAAWAIATG